MKAIESSYTGGTSETNGPFPYNGLRYLGIAILFVGIFAFLLGVVDVAYTLALYEFNCESTRYQIDTEWKGESPCQNEQLLWTWISHGIWVGLIAIIVGSLGAIISVSRFDTLRQDRDAFAVGAGILALLFAPGLIVLASLEAYYQNGVFYRTVGNELETYDVLELVVPILMAVAGFFLFILALAAMIVACCCADIPETLKAQPVMVKQPLPMIPAPQDKPPVIMVPPTQQPPQQVFVLPPPTTPEPIIIPQPPPQIFTTPEVRYESLPQPPPLPPPPPPEPIYIPVPVAMPPPPPEIRYVEAPPPPPEIRYVQAPPPPPEVRYVEEPPPRRQRIVEVTRRSRTPPPSRSRRRIRVSDVEPYEYVRVSRSLPRLQDDPYSSPYLRRL